MQSSGNFHNGSRYQTEQVVAFANNARKHGVIGEAFFDSVIEQNFTSLARGKRVLDVGCGAGNWCYIAAQCGAKRVDGLDIQEKMVEMAKQATSALGVVHIQVGDATNMPYDDDSFDLAISLFVSKNMPPERFENYFREIFRVLAHGGKAMLLIQTDWSCSRLYTKADADPTVVENDIAQIAAKLPKYPSTAQVTEAFKDHNSVINCCLSVDEKGDLFLVKSITQLAHGQRIWKHTDIMMFPNFFYSDSSTIKHILAAGFHIDSIENYFTEERRTAYNSKESNTPLIEKFVKEPTALAYYISKPQLEESL